MKNSSYSNNIIKSDYVKVKGTVSLNYFNFKEKEELPVNEEVEDHNEKRLELLRLEEKINQKLIDAQICLTICCKREFVHLCSCGKCHSKLNANPIYNLTKRYIAAAADYFYIVTTDTLFNTPYL